MRQQRGIHLLTGILAGVALPGQSLQINFPIPARGKSKEQGKEDMISCQPKEVQRTAGRGMSCSLANPLPMDLSPVCAGCLPVTWHSLGLLPVICLQAALQRAQYLGCWELPAL